MCDKCVTSDAGAAEVMGCSCGTCRSIGRMDALDRLRLEDAIDWMLTGVDRQEVERAKAKNPLLRKDLLRIEKSLSGALRSFSDAQGDNAARLFAELLDVSFEATPAYAEYMIEQISVAYPKFGEAIADSALPVTAETAAEIIDLTRKAMAKLPALSDMPKDWGLSLVLRDERAIEALGRKPALWIGDYYAGPKIVQAREIIYGAMELGLGRDQTAEVLKEMLGASFKDYAYFDVVASSVTTRARSWSVLTSMQAAEFDTYGILPVGDERTCFTCLALSKYDFKVERAITTMESTFGLDDPDAVKERTPWLQWDENKGENGDAYYTKGDQKHYLGDRSAESLQAAGLGILPLHPRCRCVPEIRE